MIGNLKTLCLGLFAAFALSATAAAGASAATHHFEPTGEPLGVVSNTTQIFNATEGGTKVVECEKVGVTGEVTETSTEATVTPKYEECEAEIPPNRVAAKVTTNNCHYTFHGETTHTEGETAGEHAAVTISECEKDKRDPEEPKAIVVDVTGLNLPCLAVPEQTLHGIKYLEDPTTGKDQIVKATVHGIHSITTSACGTPGEEHTNGTYAGEITVSGTEVTTNATP